MTDAVKQSAASHLASDAIQSIRLILDATRNNAPSGKKDRYVWGRDDEGRVVLQVDAACALSVALVRGGVRKLLDDARTYERLIDRRISFSFFLKKTFARRT